MLEVFDEDQVFRIDHYLGKETVQNMLAFRFANGLFEPIWNRNYIDNVQITAAEDIGIGSARRLLRLLGRAARPRAEPHAPAAHACCAWSRRSTFYADEVRDEKVKVLHAIHPPSRTRWPSTRCAPSTPAGIGGRGGGPRAISRRTDVPEDSQTETYAALRLEVDNWRWAGVPIYLRTGKRLARKVTEIAVTLKPVPHLAFREAGSVGVQPNQIVLTMQPNEGVSLSLGAKIPGSPHADPPGEHGVPLRHGVHVASRPRPTSG